MIDKFTLMAGTDFFFPPFMTMISQPSLKDISYLGEMNFFSAVSMFSGANKESVVAAMLENVPDEEKQKMEVQFNYTIANDLEAFYKLANGPSEIILNSFMTLIFPSLLESKWVKVGQTKKIWQLTFKGNKEEKKSYQMNLEIYEQLREVVKDLFTYETEESKENQLRPAGEMAQKIADKIKAAQDRRAKIYGDTAKKQDDSPLSTMMSMLVTIDKIPITEVLKMTFVQLLVQLNRSQLFDSYQTQIQLGAFAGIDGDLVDWQKPL